MRELNKHLEREEKFPSAISRYLVSNLHYYGDQGTIAGKRFHPLYRGTWFPTVGGASAVTPFTVSIRYIAVLGFQLLMVTRFLLTRMVSIRYIAVLGFQPYLKNAPSDQRRRKRFTHPPVE